MAELLLELYSEEIPSGIQVNVAEQIKNSILKKFLDSKVSFGEAKFFVTPHRMSFVINDIPTTQEATSEERRGPRVGAPEKAVEGFCKSIGFAKEDLTIKDTGKGEFYFAIVEQKAQKTSDILKHIIEETLNNVSLPKSMRWGSYDMRWIRPLHNILCVFDKDILPVVFGHITARNITKGHRFMAPEDFSVTDFSDYREKLYKKFVILDQEERKELILNQANKLALNTGSILKEDNILLDEITGLVEYPITLIGKIDSKFLDVPQEALISSMRSHQKYFSLLDDSGKIAPYFITVANIDSKDNGKKIINGNQRVLSARLEDAKFFWDQDRKEKLEFLLPKLSKIVFHAKLGTVADKVERIKALSGVLSSWIPSVDVNKAVRAAELSKADLVTEMVNEFPELQGLMGYYYANDNKEDPQVSLAIKEHYSPVGPKDSCPESPVSIVVALADKIDSLVGLFSAGDKPTGSKDPYALRRAALGVIRIILENNLRISLNKMLEEAISQYPDSLFNGENNKDSILADLKLFFFDRLRVVLKDKNIRYDIVDAVLFSSKDDDFTGIVLRANALNSFIESNDGYSLLTSYKRAFNIVSAEEKKDNSSHRNHQPDSSYLQESQEIALLESYREIAPKIESSLKEDDFVAAMKQLSRLCDPVNEFFDNITVNCDDAEIRKNRLYLLAEFENLVNRVGDFSKIESS